jgi:hypothetical protein
MSALIGLALVGCVIWFCRTETPAVARSRDDVEDEPTGWGPGEY